MVTTGEIAQTEKLKIISNELWGSSIAGTQEYEWYSAEISNLDTEGMQSWPNQRVFFLRLPTISQTRFELIPKTALSQLFDSNMKLESSQFNELFRIVRGSGTQGVDVTQVLNPVAMSVFLTIVQTDGPMRLWYQNNKIAILPYQVFPQVTAVSAPTETNMYAVIVDSQNQAMVKAYVDGIFLRVNTILQSLEQVVREPA